MTWSLEDAERRLKEHFAATAGKPAPEPTTGHGHGAQRVRPPDECETWAQNAIDAELDLIETDPPGTRNARLNDRALRCFRVAMAADFDLDDVSDALFTAARVAGDTPQAPHTPTEIRKTLRSARTKAVQDGPAYPRDLIRVVEVDELGATP